MVSYTLSNSSEKSSLRPFALFYQTLCDIEVKVYSEKAFENALFLAF